MTMDYSRLPLEAQVAQLFMVGYEGMALQPITQRFLQAGVGGLIFFRDNFESRPQSTNAAQSTEASIAEAHGEKSDAPHVSLTAQDVWTLLRDVRAALPANVPPPLFGIDQEGGQVERLPHTLFPTTVTPRAVALSRNPKQQAQSMYGLMARRLASLGFNLNFCPTLDVNFIPENPIIGVRAFGDDSETVWDLGQVAISEMAKAGIIPVGKHFPGHGNGTVDSHLDLPTLHFTEAELQPFRQAITEADLPAMLVAHGFYPDLQTTDEEKTLPSSASPAILQTLLRKQCGFNGVIITDDMCMGAITRHRNPVEAALASLRAGVDILLYRRSSEAEWDVYQAVLEAFRSGDLPITLLQQSLARIAALKSRFSGSFQQAPFESSQWQQGICREEADAIALTNVSRLSGEANAVLPVPLEKCLLLIHPDRFDLGNYAWDVATSDSLDDIFRQAGYQSLDNMAYPFKHALTVGPLLEKLDSTPDIIVFVAFNALLNTEQAALYRQVKARFPSVPLILVSAATPYDAQVMPEAQLHVGLCSYRPASMRALAQVIRDGWPGLPVSSAVNNLSQVI